jgi:hypothetical protein
VAVRLENASCGIRQREAVAAAVKEEGQLS